MELSNKSEYQDIDESDKADPRFETDYVCEIYDYLRAQEVKFQVPLDYLKIQKHLTEPMRSQLIDWLCEVQGNFRLCSESLFLCVNFVDRFLAKKANVLAKDLQLIGATAMVIATNSRKYILLRSVSLYL